MKFSNPIVSWFLIVFFAFQISIPIEPTYGDDVEVPLEIAVERIEAHIAFLDESKRVMDALYDKARIKATMKQILDRKVDELEKAYYWSPDKWRKEIYPVIKNLTFPDTRAEEIAGLWEEVRKNVHDFHLNELEQSINEVFERQQTRKKGYALESELSYLDRRMECYVKRYDIPGVKQNFEDYTNLYGRLPLDQALYPEKVPSLEEGLSKHREIIEVYKTKKMERFRRIGKPKDSPPCCEIKEDGIFFPITKHYLRPPDIQEAFNHPAIGAYNVFLHDGSFFDEQTDLFVPSVGIDFEFVRIYRSNVKTEGGGLLGAGWDFNYNKQIIPKGGTPNFQGAREEPKADAGELQYLNGAGRVDVFKHKTSRETTVKNFGPEFKALVSTYEPPAGFFAELSRYVVLPDSTSPFAEVSGFEGRLFYVMRFKDGFLEIYNCRGQLGLMQDRHGNKITFIYGDKLHPLTFNPVLETVIDTAGREYQFEYEEVGEKESVFTFYDGWTVKRPFPKLRLKSVTDFAGRKIEFQYQDSGKSFVLEKVIRHVDGLQQVTQYGYSEDDLLTTITAPREAAAGGTPILVNHWDDKGYITGQTMGGEWKILWGENSQITDRSGHVHQIRLVKSGDTFVISQTTDPSGASTQYEHNADCQITKITKPEGNTLSYEYDTANESVSEEKVAYDNNLSKGNLLKITFSAGSKRNGLSYSDITISFDYENLFNQIKRVAGPGNLVTEYTLKRGNPVEETYPAKNVKYTYRYTPEGLLEESADPLGDKTNFTYTKEGYLTSISGPSGNFRYEYDSLGNVISLTDPRGTVISFKVNERGLVEEEIEDANGFANHTQYQYDLNNNTTQSKTEIKDNFDPRSESSAVPSKGSQEFVVGYEYNLLNRITRKTETAGSVSRTTSYEYDPDGNVIKTTRPDGATVEMKYDPRGLLIEKKIGVGGTEALTETCKYDKNGNKISGESGGAKILFETDGFDRPFKTTMPLGTEIEKHLSPMDSLELISIKGSNPAGAKVDLMKTKITNDEFGHPIRVEEYILGQDGSGQKTQKTQKVRDALGRVIKLIDSQGNETLVEYGAYGITKQTDPLGNEVIYEYGPGGSVVSITEREKEIIYVPRQDAREPGRTERTKSYAIKLDYDSLGRLVRITKPGNVVNTFGYNSRGDSRFFAQPGLPSVSEWDGLGRKVREMSFAHIGDEKITTDYRYDLNDRLISVEMSQGGGKLSTRSYEYNSLDQMTRAIYDSSTYEFQHDPRGNLIVEKMPNGIVVQREYDPEDRLIHVIARHANEIHQSGSRDDKFQYDGLGRVTKAERYSGFVKNQMAYDSLGNILREEQIVGGKGFTVLYEYDERGLRKKMSTPALLDIPARTFFYTYDKLGRLTGIGDMAKGHAPSELDYVYSGFSRIARRMIGSSEQMLYHYDDARSLCRIQLFSGIDRGLIVWNGGFKYSESGLLQKAGSRYLLAREIEAVEGTAYDYTPSQSLSRSHLLELLDEKPANVSATSTKRLNQYDGGKLRETLTYYENTREAPSQIYGKTTHSVVRANKIVYHYQGNKIARTEFHGYEDPEPGLLNTIQNFIMPESYDQDFERGLMDEQIRAAMMGPGKTLQTNHFQYDENGNMISDVRFRYSFDYTDRLTRTMDTWDMGRGFEEEANYFYDYLNRLVYISHEPKTQPEVQHFRRNVRILYDEKLPYAELETNFEASPTALNAFYVTHPEGHDIGPALLRIRGNKGYQTYLPHFDGQGRLIGVSDENGAVHKLVHEFEAPDQRIRLRHMVASKSGKSRIEFPMTSLTTRWEPFAELDVQLPEGQFLFDHARNLQQEWQDVVDEIQEVIHAKIESAHRAGMAVMSIYLAPLFFTNMGPLLARQLFRDMAVTVLLTSATGDLRTLTLQDQMLYATYGLFFGSIGLERAALGKFMRPYKKVAEKLGSEKARYAMSVTKKLEDTWEDIDIEDIEMDEATIWNKYHVVIAKKISKGVTGYLKETARDGYRLSKSLLADIRSRKLRIVLDPTLESSSFGGKFVFGTNVIRINPRFRVEKGVIKIGNIKEMTAAMIHEYAHYLGYNELRAHWEQILFLIRLQIRHPGTYLNFPGNITDKFLRVWQDSGKGGAINYIESKVTGLYSKRWARMFPKSKLHGGLDLFEIRKSMEISRTCGGRYSLIKKELIAHGKHQLDIDHAMGYVF